ncbi:MAG: metallophosphoesterase family protein, partial [Polyangiaceae bacterium]
ALMSLLQDLPHGLVLHGHLHRRQQRTLLTRAGKIPQIGATSASLHHASGDKMAGYNLYEIGDHGALRVEAVIYDPTARTFRVDSVPRYV